jgi:hypothetical protein
MRYSLPIRIPRPAKLFRISQLVNCCPKFEPTPWSAKFWMLNRLGTGTLGLVTEGLIFCPAPSATGSAQSARRRKLASSTITGANAEPLSPATFVGPTQRRDSNRARVFGEDLTAHAVQPFVAISAKRCGPFVAQISKSIMKIRRISPCNAKGHFNCRILNSTRGCPKILTLTQRVSGISC